MLSNCFLDCSVLLLAALLAAPAGAQNDPVLEARLTVTGDTATTLSLGAADLARMPRETAAMEEPGRESAKCEGVPVQAVLEKAGVRFGSPLRGKALAGYVLASARDGYQVVFSLGEVDAGLGGARIIVADRCDGKPLAGDRGPLRLVVATDKRPARSVRMLERLQVVQLRK